MRALFFPHRRICNEELRRMELEEADRRFGKADCKIFQSTGESGI